ncbi:CgeB family protein [Maridesulfovibrio bastinii]|uniref:CgeB family protein n=1 Tax=Maridesulfovibrio bastinii TaxID=47157 RepID=UPI0004074F0E|nr:glycosyltransferase [Maridesulfovibrio bastinii]
MINTPYTAEAVYDDSKSISDIRINIAGKVWHMWGRNGYDREILLSEKAAKGKLPVMLGAGLGYCLEKLSKKGPVAVIDKNNLIGDIVSSEFKGNADNVYLIAENEAALAIQKLREWQQVNGNLDLEILKIPVYLRLDKEFYGSILNSLTAKSETDFWSAVNYPKFNHKSPRILFLDRKYFLINEIKSALTRNNIKFRCLDVGNSDTVRNGFVEDLLSIVVEFKPDFVLTVNHFGIDREGRLTELLHKLNLPLASWFVDNPYLILYRYDKVCSDKTAIFTYDAGNLEIMRDRGFSNVFYLPLATDIYRFKPGCAGANAWKSDISFLGNSMVAAVSRYTDMADLPTKLHSSVKKIAAEFKESEDLSVSQFLKRCYPALLQNMNLLPTDEQKLAYEALITWEATRLYRLNCIKGILDFNPLIVGDQGWNQLLADKKGWRYLESIDYYADLPGFYPQSKINFNCTSRQMKGAVNQRVFDVPACGAFVLTDYREQVENLFEPGVEIITYRDRSEIKELTAKYLKDKNLRESVSKAARKRILSEHTYENRLSDLIDKMRRTFGGGNYL